MRTYKDLQLYSDWVATYDTLDVSDRQAIRDRVGTLRRSPLFSFIMLPPSDGTLCWESVTITSIRDQLYPHWELWLPGCTRGADTRADKRMRDIPSNGTNVAADADLFNGALALAEGDFVLPLLSDMTLPASALFELAVEIADNPEADLIYTDEDRVTEFGERCMPRFKTAWDPDLILGRDAIGLLVVYRKTLLAQLGGMMASLPSVGLSLYEMSLRVAFATSAFHIRHLPAILCHRAGDSGASLGCEAQAARAIVRKQLANDSVNATVLPAPLASGWNRVIRDLPAPAPLVSIIVPTRDRKDLLERVADGVLSRTDYPALELLIVDNNSQEPGAVELLQRLSRDSRVRVIPYPLPFNFSAQNNLAAREARGEILVLLNSDVDVIRPDWLQEMVSHAVRPDVGVVGAKLLYPDGRIQHGGMVLGPTLWPAHQLRFADRLDPGPGGELALTRTVSIVTGACLAVRRSVFFEIGGLDEELKVEFNDIDFCLRIGDHGYRVVWTPFAELFHFERATRGDNRSSSDGHMRSVTEASYFGSLWRSLLKGDPFHNPNVIYDWDSAVLASPPRRERPWLT